MGTPQIAKLCRCCSATISYWLKKYNIKTRTISEAMHVEGKLRSNINNAFKKEKKRLE